MFLNHSHVCQQRHHLGIYAFQLKKQNNEKKKQKSAESPKIPTKQLKNKKHAQTKKK